MHELSIVQDLIDLLEVEQLRVRPARLRAVTVEVGALSGVDPAALESAWPAAVRRSELSPDCALRLRSRPVVVRCGTCLDDRPAESFQSLRCNACGTPSSIVVGGRELDIVEMEVLDDAADPAGPDSDTQRQ